MVSTMNGSSTQNADPDLPARSRDWEHTALVAFLVAIGAGLLAASNSWDRGDLLVGIYFAAVSLGLWGQSTRIKLAGAAAPFTPTVRVALVVAFSIGVLLGMIDVVTAGGV